MSCLYFKQICYEIVGENGLVYDNVKVTVEEMSIMGEDFTINRTTGEATGELPTDASNARIRVYVKDVLYDNGSNYIIVSQTKH